MLDHTGRRKFFSSLGLESDFLRSCYDKIYLRIIVRQCYDIVTIINQSYNVISVYYLGWPVPVLPFVRCSHVFLCSLCKVNNNWITYNRLAIELTIILGQILRYLFVNRAPGFLSPKRISSVPASGCLLPPPVIRRGRGH